MWNSKMKDMRLWMVVVAMLAVTFFVPWNAHGADENKIELHKGNSATGSLTKTVTSGELAIDITDCADQCAGHYIKGYGDANLDVKIKIDSQSSAIKHDVYLDGVKIEREQTGLLSGEAFELQNSANVKLHLIGSNVLKSASGAAGIQVPQDATLTIVGENGDARLEAQGGNRGPGLSPGGAGIGGTTSITTGTIEIESGTIIARGGNGAAGIGGAQGRDGGFIYLNGGVVEAYGGMLPGSGSSMINKGGPGIGDGAMSNNSSPQAIVTITNCKVKATGGEMPRNGQDASIAAKRLSSGETGSANLIEVSPKLNDMNIDMKKFNGIVKCGNIYTVYGDAVLDNTEDFDKWWKDTTNPTLNIQDETSSLDVAKEWNASKSGKITGNGSLYHGSNIKGQSMTIDKSVTEYPIALDDGRITIDIPSQTYTGTEIRPDPIIMDRDYVLKRAANDAETDDTADYRIEEYSNNIDAGTAEVKIVAMGKKYTNPKGDACYVKEFEIVPANLRNARVTTVPTPDEAAAIYSGTEKAKPTVIVEVQTGDGWEELPETVEVDGESKKNYEIVWDETEEGFVNAGDYTVIVKAVDKKDGGTGNCTGSTEGTFVIEPKPLDILNATAQDRVFDGTNIVSMDGSSGNVSPGEVSSSEVDGAGFELNGIVDGDDVYIDTSGLTGTISSPDVGEYDRVTLNVAALKLAGKDKDNYTISFKDGSKTQEVRLAPKVKISQLVHDQPILSAESQASSEYENKFGCTITIENAQPGAKYQYKCMGKTEWLPETTSPTAYFDDLEVNQEYTFYVCVVNSKNVKPLDKPKDVGEITKRIDKLEQIPPDKFNVTFKVNEDGTTYTATIPEIEKAIYSFDGGTTWGTLEAGGNVKTDCESGHTYLACVKYPGNAIYKDSEPTIVEATAPMEQVEQPAISPNGGKFKGSQKITMTCPTSDAVIYYTLDGSDPVPDGAKTQRYTEAFEITEAANIKAIATKEYMKDSRSVSAKFEWDDSLEARIKKTDLSKVEDIPSSLQEAGFSSISDITAALSRVLTAHEGYTYQNIAYYDVTIEVSSDRKTWREAKPEDFPKDGLSVTIPYPSGTTKNGNDFIAAHMFSTTDTDLGTEAGGIEEPSVSKTTSGLQMKLTGMSPLGIAWKVAAADNTNGSTNATNSTNGTGANGANGANGTAARVQADGDDNGADGADGGDAASEDDSTADEAAENGSDSNSEDGKVGSALSSLLPQTSDGRTILLWVVLAFLSAAILLALKAKGKKD